MNPTTGFESFKRRHARQNRELARSNAFYSQQIRKYQTDLALLRRENLLLRQELIQWTVLRQRQTQVSHAQEEQEQQFESPPMSPSPQPQLCPQHRSRRQRAQISYALPSVKKKLRKGDPFTFGN